MVNKLVYSNNVLDGQSQSASEHNSASWTTTEFDARVVVLYFMLTKCICDHVRPR